MTGTASPWLPSRRGVAGLRRRGLATALAACAVMPASPAGAFRREAATVADADAWRAAAAACGGDPAWHAMPDPEPPGPRQPCPLCGCAVPAAAPSAAGD